MQFKLNPNYTNELQNVEKLRDLVELNKLMISPSITDIHELEFDQRCYFKHIDILKIL